MVNVFPAPASPKPGRNTQNSPVRKSQLPTVADQVRAAQDRARSVTLQPTCNALPGHLQLPWKASVSLARHLYNTRGCRCIAAACTASLFHPRPYQDYGRVLLLWWPTCLPVAHDGAVEALQGPTDHLRCACLEPGKWGAAGSLGPSEAAASQEPTFHWRRKRPSAQSPPICHGSPPLYLVHLLLT